MTGDKMDWLLAPAVDYTLAQDLFLKGMALVYLLAFWALSVQIRGLYGSKGVIPLAEILRLTKERSGTKAYFKAPSIFWINSSDLCQSSVCIIGMTLSMFALFGWAPLACFIALWGLYLSIVTVGSVFLSFQWDILLLETGFITIFLSIQTPAPLILIYLVWVLLFRFMFSSGIVKLLSGCPEWRSLKAMDYHYLTQPIPNKLAYYVHNRRDDFGKLSVLATYFLEMVVPFFIFAPPSVRVWVCGALFFLQLTIFATGNYAFFNILSAVLCIPLLSNQYMQWFEPLASAPEALPANETLTLCISIVAAALILLNILKFVGLFYKLKPFQVIFRWLAPFHLVNSYGLFARMTTVRNEIVVEGSMDGKDWKTYEFKWKPGDLYVPPKQVAPYHPRLDWQMWFAALGNFKDNPWFYRFLVRLLEGSPDVQLLLRRDPFPKTPPKYVRSLLYEYHFSDIETFQRTGQWWVRTAKGAYSPVLALKAKN
jgi:hypothetical protein